jgi:hypothetical protein
MILERPVSVKIYFVLIIFGAEDRSSYVQITIDPAGSPVIFIQTSLFAFLTVPFTSTQYTSLDTE